MPQSGILKVLDLNKGDTQLIIKECARQGLSKAHTAYVLATTWRETNGTMKPVREAYWLSEAWRKRNLRYFPWYGRGYVQLTWEKNYKDAGARIGEDLTTNPDVVMQPEIAATILVRGMKEGWFTGKKMSDYTSFDDMRPIVNGDTNYLSDKNNPKSPKVGRLIADKAREYEKALPDPKVKEGGLLVLLKSLFKILFRS